MVMEEQSEAAESPKPKSPNAGVKKAIQVLYFILGVIEVLLLTRFLLLLLGANIYAGFAQLIQTLTDPLMAPFAGLFPPRQGEVSTFSMSTLVAMAVYAVLFYGIAKLIKIVFGKKQ